MKLSRSFVSIAFSIILVASINACTMGADAVRPNVVLILADDLGWGDLAAYGHPYAKTPNLDQLANEGILFHRFYVTGRVCVPSRTGFMTSRSPATFVKYPKDAGFQGRATITEMLKNGGYATGHFGKWHIGDEKQDGTYGIDKIKRGGHGNAEDGRDARVFEAAIRFIEKHRDVPFYVNVWGRISHFPVAPHPSLAAIFKDISVRREDFSKHMQVKFDEAESVGGNLNEGMANYLGELYSLDLSVGKLLQKLDELGLREETIVVFASDNGPAPVIVDRGANEQISPNMLGSAGELRGGKHDFWEGGVRSPFIIRWPGEVPAGKINTTSITSALDWLPTIAAIAGIPYDKSMFEGEDVSDIWRGADRSRKNPLFWRQHTYARTKAMLQGDWKLHVDRGETSLYNLSDDPEESEDLAERYKGISSRLVEQLEAWNESLPNEEGTDAVVMAPIDLPLEH